MRKLLVLVLTAGTLAGCQTVASPMPGTPQVRLEEDCIIRRKAVPVPGTDEMLVAERRFCGGRPSFAR